MLRTSTTPRARRALGTLLPDQRGAVAVEYSLMASLVGLTLAISAQDLGSTLNSEFVEIASIFGAPSSIGMTPVPIDIQTNPPPLVQDPEPPWLYGGN